MKTGVIVLLTMFLVGVSRPIDGSDAAASVVNQGEIMLTETTLGKMPLDRLNERNMLAEIKKAFPGLKVIKGRGQQDGPDYNYYKVSRLGEEIFFIAMDGYDSTRIERLSTSNKMIRDQYGISAGEKIEEALKKRKGLRFHADLHYNIYATEVYSSIGYRLEGNFTMDTALVLKDYQVEPWQVEGMEVGFLIWRKQ